MIKSIVIKAHWNEYKHLIHIWLVKFNHFFSFYTRTKIHVNIQYFVKAFFQKLRCVFVVDVYSIQQWIFFLVQLFTSYQMSYEHVRKKSNLCHDIVKNNCSSCYYRSMYFSRILNWDSDSFVTIHILACYKCN